MSQKCFKPPTEVQYFYNLQVELILKTVVEILRCCLHHFLELQQHGAIKFTKPANT